MTDIPASILSAARFVQAKWKVPASVQIAQWILESGWGAHSPGNNPFGMKPRKGKNDPFQILTTKEYSKLRGKMIDVPQPFRTFPSIAAAFDAHAELLATAPVYQPAMKALPNLSKFISLMAMRYATDPRYYNKLFDLIVTNHLTQYDSNPEQLT